MQVFKCSLRIIRANMIFPLVYIVGLSFMGLFMAVSFDFGSSNATFQRAEAEYAIVDRDDSALSRGIASALEDMGTRVDVADTRQAFQDASAKDRTDYLLIIPDGYGEAFAAAAKNDDETPRMETVYSFYSMEGSFVDEAVNGFLSNARTLFAATPDASMEDVVREALEASTTRAATSVIESADAVSEADRFVFYLQWNTYTLFAGITVCIGMLTATMSRVDVRRRNLVSPLPFMSYNLQLGLACLMLALAAWAWSFGVGIVAFPDAVAAISTTGLIWCGLSMLAFCLIPLSVGFLLGQLGASATATNAVGNILGMVVSFFGGAWISTDLMSSEVLAIAHFLPGFWYNEACRLSAGLEPAASLDAVAPVLACLGVLALYALAVFCASLVASRLRTQTSDAGGNAAAEAAA